MIELFILMFGMTVCNPFDWNDCDWIISFDPLKHEDEAARLLIFIGQKEIHFSEGYWKYNDYFIATKNNTLWYYGWHKAMELEAGNVNNTIGISLERWTLE